jgi:hypothetical protein
MSGTKGCGNLAWAVSPSYCLFETDFPDLVEARDEMDGEAFADMVGEHLEVLLIVLG